MTMPWTPDEAERHTHKAATQEMKDPWAKVANERLESTGDEARAIREANAVVARKAEHDAYGPSPSFVPGHFALGLE